MSKAMFQESRGERLSNWATDCHVQEEKGTQQVLALSAPTDQFLEGSRQAALPIRFHTRSTHLPFPYAGESTYSSVMLGASPATMCSTPPTSG